MKTLNTIILLLGISVLAHAIEIPHLSSPVIDQAGLLDRNQKSQIESLLYRIKKNKGPQIQLLTVKSLQGESIENFSIEVVDKWKLGDKERDDGVLFLVSTGDRELRIEVGDGLEGILTDYKSGKIVRGVTKYFKARQFDQGILYGITEIVDSLGIKANNLKVKKLHRDKRSRSFSFFELLAIMGILFFRVLPFGRFRGGYYRSSGRYSGSSWSGGGGGFSGGGSSGSW